MFSFDSDEELYFSWWLDEITERGLIVGWSRTIEPIKLTDPLYQDYTQTTTLKTKVKTERKRQTLLNGSVYTPDFKIFWDYDKGMSTLWDTPGFDRKIVAPFIAAPGSSEERYYSLIEVKGGFDNQNMTRLFKNNQKFIWDKYRVYVNLVEIPDFFKKTFTPSRYLVTNKTGKPRKLSYSPRSLEEYLKQIGYAH